MSLRELFSYFRAPTMIRIIPMTTINRNMNSIRGETAAFVCWERVFLVWLLLTCCFLLGVLRAFFYRFFRGAHK